MWTRILLCVLAAPGAGCSTFLDLRDDTAPARTVTVGEAMIAGAEELADFPLLVRAVSDPGLRTVAFGGAVAFDDGTDLRFELDGTELPREIEGYDPSEGSLTAWVLVPALSPGNDLSFDLRCGGAASMLDPSDVWAAFSGVWHLADDPTATAILDSSPSASHGTASGFTVTSGVEGVAGAALEFEGGQWIDLGNPSALEMGTDSFSYSVWVRAGSTSGEYDIPFYKGGSSASYPGYDFELGNNNWTGWIRDSGSSRTAQLGEEVDLVGEWHRLTVVTDRASGEVRAYVDGAEVATDPVAGLGSVSGGVPGSIGGDQGVGNLFHGTIDEVRVARSAWSAGRIATEFANLGSAGLVVISD